MTSRIVTAKELRETFKIEALQVSDFSLKKPKNILGIISRQITIDTGVEILHTIQSMYEKEGRVLDKNDTLADLVSPAGQRRWVGGVIRSMASVKLVRGANEIETLWKSLGDLICIARRGRLSVYVAKHGATEVELSSLIDLRQGKIHAQAMTNEALTKELARGRKLLNGRTLGDAYAETCTEYFKRLKAS